MPGLGLLKSLSTLLKAQVFRKGVASVLGFVAQGCVAAGGVTLQLKSVAHNVRIVARQ